MRKGLVVALVGLCVGAGVGTGVGLFLMNSERTTDACPRGTERYELASPKARSHRGPGGIDVAVENTPLGQTFDWVADVDVHRVSATGGGDRNTYDYRSPRSSDEGLHAPPNVDTSRYWGLTMIVFCYSDR
jgi:hypothetical protein